MGLDSYQFPLRTYGDLAYRIYGRTALHGISFLQSIQRLCYAICCLVFAIAGFAIGQIRSLQKFGWLANAAIWINILIIVLTMGVAAHTPPNYLGAQAASAGAALSGPSGPLIAQLPDGSYPPVQTSAGLPDSGNFGGAVTGLMQAVYAYGGAMLYVTRPEIKQKIFARLIIETGSQNSCPK